MNDRNSEEVLEMMIGILLMYIQTDLQYTSIK